MKSKPEYHIENWMIGSMEHYDPYQAPETYTMQLFGNIEGHPNCTEGRLNQTSEIVDIDLPNRRVETRNSIYILGKINLKYYEESLRTSKKPETIESLKTIYAPEIYN